MKKLIPIFLAGPLLFAMDVYACSGAKTAKNDKAKNKVAMVANKMAMSKTDLKSLKTDKLAVVKASKKVTKPKAKPIIKPES